MLGPVVACQDFREFSSMRGRDSSGYQMPHAAMATKGADFVQTEPKFGKYVKAGQARMQIIAITSDTNQQDRRSEAPVDDISQDLRTC